METPISREVLRYLSAEGIVLSPVNRSRVQQIIERGIDVVKKQLLDDYNNPCGCGQPSCSTCN